MSNHETVLILDFGSQYNQLLTRTIRELGIYSELHSRKLTVDEIREMNPKGIILSGGPQHVNDENSYQCDEGIFDLGIPILGVCYGMQLMAKYFGGEVKHLAERTYEKETIKVSNQTGLFKDSKEEQYAWLSKGDQIIDIPKSFQVDATSGEDVITAISNEEKNMYGVQFHPEVEDSESGKEMLKQFLFSICNYS